MCVEAGFCQIRSHIVYTYIYIYIYIYYIYIYIYIYNINIYTYIYVTGSGKTGLITTITDIHFLPVRESCTHALSRNTKYLIIDGQVCFYRRLFTDAVKPPGGPGGH